MSLGRENLGAQGSKAGGTLPLDHLCRYKVDRNITQLFSLPQHILVALSILYWFHIIPYDLAAKEIYFLK